MLTLDVPCAPAGPVVDPSGLTLIAQQLDRAGPGPGTRPDARHRIGTLFPAELEVLKALADGAANGEIAERLYMSSGTVKAHISRTLTELDCDNRVQAAVLAHRAAHGTATAPRRSPATPAAGEGSGRCRPRCRRRCGARARPRRP